MRICLLGEQGETLDEGMKNISVQLQDHLDDLVDSATLLDLREISSLEFWREFRSLDPDIVHLVPGPTPHGLLLLDLMARWTSARSVATATQPRYKDFVCRAGGLLSPDLLIVQSTDAGRQFEEAGFRTEFIPSGVDLDTFTPVSENAKRDLRTELGLPQDERIFLHVGHFKEGRDVTALASLCEFGEVIVIGSPSTGPEREIISTLRSSGCHVVTEYIEHIEQYYRAADIYVFPTRDTGHSIQVPLSVFEAMACNLPVLTTRFGGLDDCFEEGAGLRFVRRIADVNRGDLEFGTVDTRCKVSDYSWDSIARDVLEVYHNL